MLIFKKGVVNYFMSNLNIRVSSTLDKNTKATIQAELDKIKGLNVNVQVNTSSIKTSVEKAIKDALKSTNVGNIKLPEVSASLKNESQQIAKIEKQINALKFNIDTEKFSSDINKITRQIEKFKSQSLSDSDKGIFANAAKSAKELELAYQRLSSAFGDKSGLYTDEQRIELAKQYQVELAKTKNILSQLSSNKDNEWVHVGDEKRVNMVNTLNNYLVKNTAMSQKSKEKILEWIKTLESSDDMTVGAIKNINTQFKTLDSTLRQSGQLGLSWRDKFANIWEKFGGWSIATGAFMKLKKEAVEGFKFIVELDDALTDVAYTSNVTSAQLEDLGNKSVGMAKELKASATNVLEAVKIYSTANATAEDILRKSKPAIMLSNVSGMSGAESAKTIQTSLNQFEIEDTEAGLMDIVDTLEYVSSQLNYDFTEGMKQITEGIEASGSVAKNAGLNMQEYSAMVGIAVEKTGQSGSTIGNAYKTILSRITKASEIEGTLADDISNAEEALRNVGVEVRSSNDDFRDMTDIMADIGEVWDGLTDKQKSKVGYEVAGIRQLNVLNSLFGAWDEYAAIMENIDDRTGTAFKNQEEHADSYKGHLQGLEATGKSIWNNILNSSALKTGIDTLNLLLTVIDKITSVLGSFGTIGLASVILLSKSGINLKDVFTDVFASITGGAKMIALKCARHTVVVTLNKLMMNMVSLTRLYVVMP